MALGTPYFPQLSTIVIGGYYLPFGAPPTHTTPPAHSESPGTPTGTPSPPQVQTIQSVLKAVFGGGG
ncbi:hypothetical protein [Sulfurisphaera tokodaii]|uniref:hypothetical protein n=1 Tax=Sulfurisphaera tokodaii TaxID=111955 RepID=UPI000699F54C